MNTLNLLNALDIVGYNFLSALLSFTWQSAIILAGALLLVHLLKNYSASARHMVLASVFIILPFIPLTTVMINSLDLSSFSMNVIPEYEEPEVHHIQDKIDLSEKVVLRSDVAFSGPSFIQPKSIDTSVASHPWAFGLLTYLVFALYFITRILFDKIKISRFMKNSRIVYDVEIVNLFATIANSIGLKSKYKLLVNSEIGTPFTFGTLKPVIFLPKSLISDLDIDELSSIASHELAHIKRRDSLLFSYASLLRAICFFNPFYVISAKRFSLFAEQACDDIALKTTSNPIHYAKMLTRIVESVPKRELQPQISAAGIIFSRKIFVRRIEAILSTQRERTKKMNISKFSALLIVIIACFAIAASAPLSTASEPVRDEVPKSFPKLEIEVSPPSETVQMPALVTEVAPEDESFPALEIEISEIAESIDLPTMLVETTEPEMMEDTEPELLIAIEPTLVVEPDTGVELGIVNELTDTDSPDSDSEEVRASSSSRSSSRGSESSTSRSSSRSSSSSSSTTISANSSSTTTTSTSVSVTEYDSDSFQGKFAALSDEVEANNFRGLSLKDVKKFLGKPDHRTIVHGDVVGYAWYGKDSVFGNKATIIVLFEDDEIDYFSFESGKIKDIAAHLYSSPESPNSPETPSIISGKSYKLFETLDSDMSLEQVVRILGTPSSRTKINGRETAYTWYQSKGLFKGKSTIILLFEDDEIKTLSHSSRKINNVKKFVDNSFTDTGELAEIANIENIGTDLTLDMTSSDIFSHIEAEGNDKQIFSKKTATLFDHINFSMSYDDVVGWLGEPTKEKLRRRTSNYSWVIDGETIKITFRKKELDEKIYTTNTCELSRQIDTWTAKTHRGDDSYSVVYLED